jgi:hexokinase
VRLILETADDNDYFSDGVSLRASFTIGWTDTNSCSIYSSMDILDSVAVSFAFSYPLVL